MQLEKVLFLHFNTLIQVTEISIFSSHLPQHHENRQSHIYTSNDTFFFDRTMSNKEMCFCLSSLNVSHVIPPTLSSLLRLLPLQLELPHDGGSGGDGG